MTNLQLPNLSYRSLFRLLSESRNGSKKIGYETRAEMMGHAIEIRHHGNLIAVLTPTDIYLSNAGWHTRTTAHRLHVVAMDNGIGGVRIKQGRMVFIDTKGNVSAMEPDVFVSIA